MQQAKDAQAQERAEAISESIPNSYVGGVGYFVPGELDLDRQI